MEVGLDKKQDRVGADQEEPAAVQADTEGTAEAAAYGSQCCIHADGNAEFRVRIGAPSDRQATTEYRCIARDGSGSEDTSDTARKLCSERNFQ